LSSISSSPNRRVDSVTGWLFSGRLDPGGTLFAFLLSVVATIALLVVTFAVVQAVGA
jgi:hypothetical protein